jgi:hypothetical protein
MPGINKTRSAFIRYPKKIKSFLLFTAIIEALTGISLIVIPSAVIYLLLGLSISGPAPTIAAMLAGIGVSCIAIICWLLKDKDPGRSVMKMVIFYNGAVPILMLYGVIEYGLNSPGLWLVSGFHFIQAVRGFLILRNGQKKLTAGVREK